METQLTFDHDLLINNYFLKSIQNKENNASEQSIDNEKEIWVKKNTFPFKEKILFNNLNTAFVEKLHFNLSNLYYFQNYHTSIQDFDSVNFEHVQTLRKNYLVLLTEQTKEKKRMEELKKDNNLINNNDYTSLLTTYYETNKKTEIKDNITDITSYLITILLFDGDKSFKEILMIQLLDNIIIEIKNNYNKKLFYRSVEIESNLIEFIDKLESNYFTTNQLISQWFVEIINKIEHIACLFNSSLIFIKTLLLMKKHNLILNNFREIKNKYFKKRFNQAIDNLLNINYLANFTITTNNAIHQVKCVNDEKFIYALLKSALKNNWILYKLKLITKKDQSTIIILEKTISISNSCSVRLIHDSDKKQLVIASINNDTYEIITINKNNFQINSLNTYVIPQKSTKDSKVTMFTNSQSSLYLYTDKTIIKITNYTINPQYKYIEYQSKDNQELQTTIMEYFSKEIASFHVGNVLIYFVLSNRPLLVYDISKNSFSLRSSSDDDNINYSFDNKTNYFLTTQITNKAVKISINVNSNVAYESWDNIDFAQIIQSKQKLKEKFPSQALIKRPNHDKLINKTNKTPIEYSTDEKTATAYFNYFFMYLAKYYFYFGNVHNMYIHMINHNKQNNDEAISDNILDLHNKVLSKTFVNNNGSTEFLHLLFSLQSNPQYHHLNNWFLLILQNVIENYFFFSIHKQNLNKDFEEIVQWAFEHIENEVCFNIFSIIHPLNRYYDIMKEDLQKDISLLKRILYYIIINQQSTRLLFRISVLQNIFAFEIQLIINADKVNTFIISRLKELKNKVTIPYTNIVLEWDCNFENKDSDGYLLFIHILDQFSIFLKALDKIDVNSKVQLINDSLLCQALLFYINHIINYTHQHFDYSLIPYFQTILNVLLQLDKFAYSINQSSHDLTKEEIFLAQSKYSQNKENKKEYVIPLTNINQEQYVLFDSLSEINNQSIVTINSMGPFNNYFPSEAIHFEDKTKISNIYIDYQSPSLQKEEGFSMKIWNYSINKYDVNTTVFNIITEIKRSLMYSIGGLLYNNLQALSLNTNKQITSVQTNDLKLEKEVSIMKNLFASKLFENMTLVDTDNQIEDNEQFKSIMDLINHVKESSFKSKTRNNMKEVFTIKYEKKNNQTRSQDIINNIRGKTNYNYCNTIDALHTQFINKAIWGKVNDQKIRPLILCLFCIILKNERLLDTFDDFTALYSQKNTNINLMSLPNASLFLQIYSELSKIKIWLKEKETYLMENDKHEGIIEEDNIKNSTKYEIFINRLISKGEFLLNALKEELPIIIINNKLSSEIVFKEKKEKEFSDNLKDIIDNLVLYLKSEEIEECKLKEKIASQNKYAVKKELTLLLFNFLLSYLKNQQNIKDLVYWSNKVIKNNSLYLTEINHDLYGADPVYSQKVKIQIYNNIMIVLDKLKEHDSLQKNCYDISYYTLLTQSIFWRLRKRDYPLIQVSNLFDIFIEKSIISKALSYNTNNTTEDNKHIYGITKININTFTQEIFNLFSLYTFIIFDKFNELNVQQNTKIPIQASHLSFKRKISDIDEIESFTIINQVSHIIISLLEKYNQLIQLFKSNYIKNEDLINEEKLNDFLLLLYRSLSFNKKLISYFKQNYSQLLSILLEIMLYSSEKNKLIIIKLIEIFTVEYDKEFFTTSIHAFKEHLLTNNKPLLSFISSSNDDNETINTLNDSFLHFYFLTLFKYTFLLQNNQLFNYFFQTNYDISFSWDIINYLQKLLLTSSYYQKQLLIIIQDIFKNELSNNNLSTIAFFILGVDLPHIHVGSRVEFDYSKEPKVNDINIFCQEQDSNQCTPKQNKKTGFIIGFTNQQNKLLTLNEETDHLFMIEEFYYTQQRFAIVVLEEMINRQNINLLSFNTFLTVETLHIQLFHENYYRNTEILIEMINHNIIKSIFSQLPTKKPPQLVYLSLSLIKKIITSQIELPNQFTSFLTPTNINLLVNLSLSTLNIQSPLMPLELIEPLTIELLCSIPKESKQEEKKEPINSMIIESSKKREVNDETPTVLLTDSSFFLKINGNLLFESVYKNIYNYQYFSSIEAYMPLLEYDCSDDKMKGYDYALVVNSSILCKEIIEQIKLKEKEIKCLITNIDLNDNHAMIELLTITLEIPIIIINEKDYMNHFDFIFRQIPNDDFENLFMRSIEKDFTSLIDIPTNMVDDSANFDQRSIALKILKEVDSPTIIETIIPNGFFKPLVLNEEIINRMISMIARRITIIIISKFKNSREKVSLEEIMTIIKLLLFESNIYKLDKERNFTNNQSSFIEINSIIQSLLYNIVHQEIQLNQWDINLIKTILDNPFKNGLNYIDYSILSTINSEQKLIECNNIENNIKMIFSILPFIVNMANLSNNKEYKMELFNNLLLKINIFKIQSQLTYTFILDALLFLMKNFIEQLNQGDPNIITNLINSSYIFFSPEFLSFTDLIDDHLKTKDQKDFSGDEIKILNFIFLYFEIALKASFCYNIDLNIRKFLETKLMNIYFVYSVISTNYNRIEIFLLFCYKRGFININEDKIIVKHDFSYYDSTFTVPHLVGFSYKDCEQVFITVKEINKDLIGIENCIFIYSDKECRKLQDYIRNDETNKRLLIQNKDNNSFFISFPYTHFKNNLYGCGSNEKQSLGCGGNSSARHILPQKCLGLENVKNIKDFKFGFYHTFVHNTDGNLYVCGYDWGSSLKKNKETPQFVLESHFQDISQKEGIVGIWVNNYNSSIMVTQTNNIYGCGLNNEYCLTSAFGKDSAATIPFLMSPIKQKVIKVACGFKSTLLILEDGTARTVGSNANYQCGSLTIADCTGEYHHLDPPKGGKFKNVIAGEDYFLLLVDELLGKGRLYSLGSNLDGRAGVGNEQSSFLQKCKGVECYEFTVLSSRNASSAVITSDGELFTFGFNQLGNLGHGNTQNQIKPMRVEALIDYICDDVGISHHHMQVVARSKKTGEKTVFSAGTKEYRNLGYETNENLITKPKEVTFFRLQEFSQQPVRVTVSRYQSYFLTIETNIHNDCSIFNSIKCVYCQKEIENIIFFEQKDSKVKAYYCDNCMKARKETFIMFSSTTPFKQSLLESIEFTLSNRILLNQPTYSFETDNIPNEYEYNCLHCSNEIHKDSMLFISQDNTNLVLCSLCYKNKSYHIEYPQIFFVFMNIRPLKKELKMPRINDLSQILWNIKHTDTPYLSIEIQKKFSFYDNLMQSHQNPKVKQTYDLWSHINRNQMIELIAIKEEINNDKKDNLNSVDSMAIYKRLQESSSKYSSINKIDFDQLNLIHELSKTINDGISDLLSIVSHPNAPSFVQKAISDNIALINSTERLMMFENKIAKLEVTIPSHNKLISINRLKAIKFYEKNQQDYEGEYTVFSQLFNKMKGYPLKDYLSVKENRLFTLVLEGEGATDYGGPYCDLLSGVCDELQSIYLDLFIQTPNNKNEVGNLRDKYIPNPSAISANHIEMYTFIGYLFTHAISSCHLLNLNIHPMIWNLLLGLEISWEVISTIDYLFYKFINEIDDCKMTDDNEFNEKYDLFFVIQLSNGNEYELIPNGKKIPVTLNNKTNYVSLAKNVRLNEFSIQINSIREGIISIIPDNILMLLTASNLEEAICGKAIINLQILRHHTQYVGYDSQDPVIDYFWKAMESFTNEEIILYLKYVWGRTRIPEKPNFQFVHVITEMRISNPDKHLPAATTCYFTLKLPKYSTYEILQEKLKYAITYCAEIDTDFTVRTNNTFNAFDP